MGFNSAFKGLMLDKGALRQVSPRELKFPLSIFISQMVNIRKHATTDGTV